MFKRGDVRACRSPARSVRELSAAGRSRQRRAICSSAGAVSALLEGAAYSRFLDRSACAALARSALHRENGRLAGRGWRGGFREGVTGRGGGGESYGAWPMVCAPDRLNRRMAGCTASRLLAVVAVGESRASRQQCGPRLRSTFVSGQRLLDLASAVRQRFCARAAFWKPCVGGRRRHCCWLVAARSLNLGRWR